MDDILKGVKVDLAKRGDLFEWSRKVAVRIGDVEIVVEFLGCVGKTQNAFTLTFPLTANKTTFI